MQVSSNLSNPSKTTVFTGAREGKIFRRKAREIINELKEIKLGSFEYRCISKAQPKSMQYKLREAIYIVPRYIGKKHVRPEDRKLHEQLKALYKNFEEAEDYADAMCGGGGRFLDRTVYYTI